MTYVISSNVAVTLNYIMHEMLLTQIWPKSDLIFSWIMEARSCAGAELYDGL